MIKYLLSLFFKVKIGNLQNYLKVKKSTIFISNFSSYLDIFIYAIFLPEKPVIILSESKTLNLLPDFLIKSLNIYILRENKISDILNLIKKIKKGGKFLFFPEYQPNNGHTFAKIYEDSALIANKIKLQIVPIIIKGCKNSIFSKKDPYLKQKISCDINIDIFSAQQIKLDTKLNWKEKRLIAKELLFKILSESNYQAINKDRTLFKNLINIANKVKNRVIITDFNKTDLTYSKLIIAAILLGEKISQQVKKEERIGILLPNISASMALFFALQFINKIPAILNFSNGNNRILSAIKNANLKYVYSSKLFIKKAKLENFVTLADQNNIKIIYLEDLKAKISIFDKISAFFKAKIIKNKYQIGQNQHHNIATILFTSGSEGNPKGVALTHKNIISNISQLQSIINFNMLDRVFNSLPIFHSFGLVVGSLLPIFSASKLYLYPSPVHYNKIPKLIYNFKATIMFGTNYFLKKYSQFADNLDFSTIKYVFAGAEKITNDTKNIWFEKYGIRILEGYGATETSPVVTLNTHRHNKFNKIGKLLPKIEYKIEKIKDIKEGGKLMIKGDNVMKGYLDPKNPDKIIKPQQYYDMGDIVDIDCEGYIEIKGRSKRFIKIAGEMVSLNQVESYIRQISPNKNHAVIAFINQKDKEDLLLFTDDISLNSTNIAQKFQEKGIGTIFAPRNINHIKEIPILNTGKIDYNMLKNYNLSKN